MIFIVTAFNYIENIAMTLSSKRTMLKHAAIMAGTFGTLIAPAFAQGPVKEVDVSRPALIITNEPVPENVKSNIYSSPSQTRNITPSDIMGNAYYQPTQTLVTRKISDLHEDLSLLQGNVATLSANLADLQTQNESLAAEYYTSVATLNTQLQSGTTPGNPRLIQRLTQAENSLDSLAASVTDLNQLAISTADTASKASFLLEATRAAYGISGAVEEDHKDLAKLEDTINNTIVIIERVLNNVNDDISRTSTYLVSEKQNLRTLSLAVSNGDLYGKSLSNRPFSNVNAFGNGEVAGYPQNTSLQAPAAQQSPVFTGLSAPQALVKIRFDKPDVAYEEPVYTAMSQALQKYPGAMFDLVAVHPSRGNAAEVAIESTRARRNAEKVLRSLTQMGLDTSRVNLSYDKSAEAATSEVHIYIR